MDMSNKRNQVLLFVGLVLLVVSVIFLYSNYNIRKLDDIGQDKKENERTNNGSERKKKTTNKAYKEPSAAFDQYKRFYKKSLSEGVPYSILKNKFREACGDIKGAMFELLFLTREEDGALKPLTVDVVRFNVVKSPCGLTGMGKGIGESFRKLYFVHKTKDCDCEGASFYENGKYKIEHVTYFENGKRKRIEGLNYVLDLSEFDLTFQDKLQKPKGTEEDPVYRHPILLEDLLKTKGTKDEQKLPEFIKLKVSGIDELSEDVRTGLVYYIGQEQLISKDQTGTQRTVHTNRIKNESALNGEIAVYAETKSDNNKDYWMKLLQYRKDFSSASINLSEEVDFDHRKEDWITKEIDLQPYIDKYLEEHPEREAVIKREYDNPVRLIVPSENFDRANGTGITMYAKYPVQTETSFTVDLSAPEGTYHLLLGEEILEEKYHWPPND